MGKKMLGTFLQNCVEEVGCIVYKLSKLEAWRLTIESGINNHFKAISDTAFESRQARTQQPIPALQQEPEEPVLDLRRPKRPDLTQEYSSKRGGKKYTSTSCARRWYLARHYPSLNPFRHSAEFPHFTSTRQPHFPLQ